MGTKLYYNTITPFLKEVLDKLMTIKEFDMFRLVGGTSLSLQIGHRMSVDIDLFSDAIYGSIDFNAIDEVLKKTFKYVDSYDYGVVGMGKSYFLGNDSEDNVKLDLYYTDSFIQDFLIVNGVRLATVEEIIAMKIDVILRGGRKKDFWDIHSLISEYRFQRMLDLHKERYPYTHDLELIKVNFCKFDDANDDFNPICLQNKYWEVIKLDLLDFVKEL